MILRRIGTTNSVSHNVREQDKIKKAKPVKIDTHQHFWTPSRADYPWMDGASPILKRHFAPQDLAPLLSSQGVAGTVIVQAAPTIDETEYMLGLADASDCVWGVVGWIDMEDPTHSEKLHNLAKHPKFVGVRPMVQDIEDDDWILGDALDWAFNAFIEHGLTFDALGYPRHINQFCRIAKRYPDLRIVLDHFLKPPIEEIAGGQVEADQWQRGMKALSQNPNVFCKLSGLPTEAGGALSDDTLYPFVAHVFECFGAERVLWGSDWPVVTQACTYADWVQSVENLLARLQLSTAEKDAVWAGTALSAYQLKVPS
jgi:L-fuconolactonase